MMFRASRGRGGWLGVIGLAVVATAVAFGLGGRSASANDIAQFETVFDTDYAAAGYGGIRGDGTGNVTLSGVSGTIAKALLYWHGPTNSSDPAANASVTFAGTGITGTNIGVSSDNCWDYQNSQAYRADVTSLVAGNGNYSLSGFVGPSVDVNGVSLLVFFDDGDDANNRDVVLFHGNDSNVPGNGFDADGWNVTLAGINYDSGTASMELHVGDGQVWDDADVVVNSVTIAAGPFVFQGDTVPNGPTAADTDGGLWDIRSFDVTSLLTPGDNTLALTSDYLDDCLSLVVAAVNLPAGAAPDQPPPPEELSPPEEVSPAATVVGPETGTGTSADGSSPTWLIAALAGVGLAGAAGYTALRIRARRT